MDSAYCGHLATGAVREQCFLTHYTGYREVGRLANGVAGLHLVEHQSLRQVRPHG